jgi:hypothetical protein
VVVVNRLPQQHDARAVVARPACHHKPIDLMTPPEDIASKFFDFGSRPAAPFCEPFVNYGGTDARIRVIFPNTGKLKIRNPNGLYVFPSIRSKENDRQLSPMLLGPCRLYGNFTAKKMENAWQYSKVYPQHVGEDGEPTAEYFEWARKGWSSWKAERHPMGKGTKSAFHWWNGQRLDKVKARKWIYVPLYVEQVVRQPYFIGLKKVWEEDIKPEAERSLYLMDFDAYEYGTMSLSEVLNNPDKPMGHGFVLAMLLTNDAALRECKHR